MKQPIQIGSLQILDLNESELRQIILSYPYPHFIGQQVLKNKKTPLDILLKHTTCSEMLNNSELPKIVYEKIFEENHSMVIGYALRVCYTPVWFMEKVLEKFPNDFGFQEDISRNNYVPEHILKKLACSEYWEVRSYVITNNNVTFEILKMLQSDKEPRVLISIKEKLKRLGKIPESITWRDIPNISIQ